MLTNTKKKPSRKIFTVTSRLAKKPTDPLFLTSRCVTKNYKTHPAPYHDVIIECPLMSIGTRENLCNQWLLFGTLLYKKSFLTNIGRSLRHFYKKDLLANIGCSLGHFYKTNFLANMSCSLGHFYKTNFLTNMSCSLGHFYKKLFS